MPAYAGSPAARSGDVAGTLRLLAYLALAVALIVLDHRGGWLAQIRARGELAVQPLWWLAGLPGRVGDNIRDSAATRSRLVRENRMLRNALLIGSARLARLQTAAAENARLRGLLGAAERGGLDVQLAPILDIDLDPTRQRLVLDAGSRDGVHAGQSVIDAGGLLGQIIAVQPGTATVLLLTDPDHAVPVVVARSGVRLVAYGKGRSDQLELANIPLSSDVRVGDAVVTSGLGGRFPAGFPVGTLTALRPDDSRAFLVGDLDPAAQLDRGRDVLLLKSRGSAAGLREAPPPARPAQSSQARAPTAAARAPESAPAAAAERTP
ncbi:rod shape-determining protein MreC [Cognatiluteimonas weifangensis]|uniref:Cell shape-determining protein MreC n=1 Tax=Cognatiluteimonas weifangensis TaxID=2303539 RepID=A0A372DPW6_9GAMM|nr:rod shape-determining protein MreC [Luteimonas weifangensis]RFP61611.1 rod shape-determining protein MreC [Luteimonas weifangensis]